MPDKVNSINIFMFKALVVFAVLAMAVHSYVDWTPKVTAPFVTPSNGFVQAALGMLESRRAIKTNTTVKALSFQQFFDCSPYGIYNYSFPEAVLTYLKPTTGPLRPMHYATDYPTEPDLVANWDYYALGLPDPDDPELFYGPVCKATTAPGPTYTIGNYTVMTNVNLYYDRGPNCSHIPTNLDKGPITVGIWSSYQLNFNTSLSSSSNWEELCSYKANLMNWYYFLLVGYNETHWKLRSSYNWSSGNFFHIPRDGPNSTATNKTPTNCNLCLKMTWENI